MDPMGICFCLFPNNHLKYMGVSKNRGTPKWMVYNGKNPLQWMIWGWYLHLRKHPYCRHSVFWMRIMLSYTWMIFCRSFDVQIFIYIYTFVVISFNHQTTSQWFQWGESRVSQVSQSPSMDSDK